MDHIVRRARALNAVQRKTIDRSKPYVLYWCQASHRAEQNPAFEYACRKANEFGKPLVVLFCLTPTYPEATERHYCFMLEGILDAQRQFESRGAFFCPRLHPDPPTVALAFASAACLTVVDGAYLRLLVQWRQRVAEGSPTLVVEVESDVVVPLRLASNREEHLTAFIRPKIQRHLADFLRGFQETQLQVQCRRETGAAAAPGAEIAAAEGPEQERRESGGLASSSSSAEGIWVPPELQGALPLASDSLAPPDFGRHLPLDRGLDFILTQVLTDIDRTVRPVSFLYRGGTTEAKRRFHTFLSNSLGDYCDRTYRDNPVLRKTSAMSPYLHYGQISPVWLALTLQSYVEMAAKGVPPGRVQRLRSSQEKYLNELIYWRESCYNFAFYNPNYDSWEGLPQWARDSLADHEGDVRTHLYSERELELARTHDKYWNACQLQMVREGKMAPYMRMYWAKQILAWTPTPREALRIALRLNNKYELDGRGPNAFGGVLWCFGLKDHEFEDRPVWGKVRPMVASGLQGKIKGLREYVERFPSDSSGTLRLGLASSVSSNPLATGVTATGGRALGRAPPESGTAAAGSEETPFTRGLLGGEGTSDGGAAVPGARSGEVQLPQDGLGAGAFAAALVDGGAGGGLGVRQGAGGEQTPRAVPGRHAQLAPRGSMASENLKKRPAQAPVSTQRTLLEMFRGVGGGPR